MKYIRTIDGRIVDINELELVKCEDKRFPKGWFTKNGVPLIAIKHANTIEELIQIGDIVFYWAPNDDKEHGVVIYYYYELYTIKQNVITKLLIPVGEDYKCVAKAFPSFNLIKGKRYLVSKGKLELL